MNIPDFMPVLSRGPHASPAEGACVMEYVSFLAGEEWSDHPACTNPTLALTAQRLNDNYESNERHALLPLIPRLMGTNEGDPRELNRIITQAAVEYAEAKHGKDTYADERVRYARMHLAETNITGALWYATLAVMWGGDKVDFLSHLIDAYDKATGRTVTPEVTEADLRRCAELTGATR